MSDQQAIDPVCRMVIPKQGAITRQRGGKTYYFCSEMCASRFDADTGASRLGRKRTGRWPIEISISPDP
jgi:Cu+-exporting ATPase